jgi:hypothetical protein
MVGGQTCLGLGKEVGADDSCLRYGARPARMRILMSHNKQEAVVQVSWDAPCLAQAKTDYSQG